MPAEIQEASIANSQAPDLLFRDARTHSTWLPQPVSDDLLHELYDLAKLGPTSANTSPMRVLFLKSEGAKERLLPLMMPLNLEKTKTAPVVAIIAIDTLFYDQLHKLMPYRDIRPWFADDPAMAEEAAFRNGSLQGGYFIMAARLLGLDCGPMSGFDAAGVNAEFFPDGAWKVNFICNLGYGDASALHPRLPRLDFDEAARIL